MKEELERQLLSELETEYKRLGDQLIYLTPEVSYKMDEIVRKARKNHLGVFDEPKWPSGHEKIFVPITEIWDETLIAALDIDSKDLMPVNLTGRYPGIFKLWRMISRTEFKRMNLGKTLNRIIRHVVIDGSGTPKVTSRRDTKRKKTVPDIKNVDWFNIRFDHKAEKIEDSPIYEDFYPSQSEVSAQKDWINKDKVHYESRIDKTDDRLMISNDNPSDAPTGTFTECWRVISKQFLTGKKEDENIFVEGHIIVSNLGKKIKQGDLEQSAAQIHLIEENRYKNDDGTYDKPYRLWPLTEVQGRLPGRGLPEALQDIQLHANMSTNWRMYGNIIRNSLVAKYNPSTTGLKPGDLTKIGPTGEIPINGRMDDFQFIQMPMAPDSQGEMNLVMDFANRFVPNITQGVATPGEKPTTSLIRNQNAQGNMGQKKEDLGMNIAELLDTLVTPIIIDNLESEMAITGTREELEEFDEALAELRYLSEAKPYADQYGIRPSDQEEQAFKDEVKMNLQRDGDHRRLTIDSNLKKKLKECAASFTYAITDELLDKAVLVQKMTEELALIAQNNPAVFAQYDAGQLIDEIHGALNIPPLRKKKKSEMAPMMNPGQMPMPTGQGTLDGLGNPTSEVANAALNVEDPANLTSQSTGAV